MTRSDGRERAWKRSPLIPARPRTRMTRSQRSCKCEVRPDPWQEWQGSAFARVRSCSLVCMETSANRGLSERARTGANVRAHLPCRRSRVRVPSSALERPGNRGFCFFAETGNEGLSPRTQPSACIPKAEARRVAGRRRATSTPSQESVGSSTGWASTGDSS
jgi:hypothetical protein